MQLRHFGFSVGPVEWVITFTTSFEIVVVYGAARAGVIGDLNASFEITVD